MPTNTNNGHEKQNGAAVTTAKNDDDLSFEELKAIAGSTPLLEPEEYLSDPRPRGLGNAALPRTIFVFCSVGLFAMLGLIVVFAMGKRKPVAQAPDRAPQAPPIQPDESDQLKAQLALANQSRDTQPQNEKPKVRTPPKPKAEKEKPKAERTRVARRPERAPRARPERPTARIAPAPEEPEVDPFEEWQKLAEAGAMQGNLPEVEQTQAQTPAATEQTIAPPQQEALLASATIGEGTLPAIAEPVTTSPQSEPEPLTQAAVEPVTTSPQPEEMTPGMRGILEGRRSDRTEGGTQHEIPIGSSAEAEVSVPLVVSERGSRRSAVRLSKPLKDANGEEILPEGTTFITEVTNADVDSRIVEQTAIMVLYEKDGQTVQERVQPGVITIQGRDGNPMEAKRKRSGNGFNLGRGVSRAIANVGRELGQPETVSSIFSNGGSVSSSRDRGSAIIGGAVSGVFDEISDGNGDREEGRSGVLVVEEGQEVSVFVNGFLSVKR